MSASTASVRLLSLALVAGALARPGTVSGVQLEALEPGREWRVRAIHFHGNEAMPAAELSRTMVTKARPWYAVWQVWRPRPEFDPITFRDDLDRLRQLYRNHGYYEVRITHDVELPAEGNAVRAHVYVEEGPPVWVESVSVSLEGAVLPDDERQRLLDHLPLARGQVFEQDTYERAVVYLRTYYREHGFARVRVTRRAEVDVRRGASAIAYRVESGPSCVFGEVRVSGTRRVDPAVVRREIAFRAGEPFKQSLLERTRNNVVGLRIFGSVRIDEGKSRDPRVDVRIRVTEGPTHEVRLGVGYDTEEQLRGLASWRAYNFLGGARQLGFTARASFLRRTLAADFLQPHFPGRNDRIRLLLSETQEEEDSYSNDRARLSPRIEFGPLPTVTPYAFYRIEYDSLSDIPRGVKRAFPEVAPSNTLLSGFGFGVDWNATDDLLDPRRGWVASASVEPVGSFLGGEVSFLRVVGEGRWYQPLPGRFLGAVRLRLGTADPIGDSTDIPFFERFYAGGINSVRGYERRHVGPFVGACSETKRIVCTSDSQCPGGETCDLEPFGGKTLVEGSLELRHPITKQIDGAVFFDAGQVSRRSFDFPFGDLRYGTGFGVRYKSPVGPLRLDLGFPVQAPPRGDSRWQIHVSIGQAF